jgi:predicted kinase
VGVTPVLIAFSGLPGVGKTVIARLVAKRLDAVYLRIDSAEQALRRAGEIASLNISGYAVCYALAADNLRLGRIVIADSVNPIAVTRNAWRNVAETAGARLVAVELICRDVSEHRRRVKTRRTDIDGLQLPDWQAVRTREYEKWADADLAIDTSETDAEAAADRIAMLAESILSLKEKTANR